MNYWAVIYRFSIALLIVLLVIGLILVFIPPTREIREYHQRHIALTEENERLAAQVRDLVERQARFRTDPAFVEVTAREAGMVKSNEFIYRVDDDLGARAP